MRAGKLRHRITIEQVTETRAADGTPSESWSAFATVWAEKVAVEGNERFVAEREHAEVTDAWTIRHLAGVTPKMRISYDSRVFDIESAFDPDGRKRELTILTREEV